LGKWLTAGSFFLELLIERIRDGGPNEQQLKIKLQLKGEI
jgi:hypothetical protein